MFGFLFGRWPKASQCKKVLQQLQTRLKLLKNKKYATSRYLRHHIALFIRINDHARALLRTKQLILVENSISIYNLLLQFSDFILLHFSSIRKHRELLDDNINEAVSSLVFASASCGGELPGLITTKDLFGQRYGQNYVTTALQLLPGNLVNFQIKKKLPVTSISDELKSKLVDEIEKEAGHRFEMLMLECKPQIEKQVNEDEEKKVMDSDLNSCSGSNSLGVYKFSFTNNEEEKSKGETSMEDDCIEEVQVGRDQGVFRFRESSEEDRSPLSLSLLRGFKDMETLRYYKRQKKSRRRRIISSSSSSTNCCKTVYNVYSVKKEKEGEEEEKRSLLPKHVHPKLPDYDQIIAQFTELGHSMHS